MSTAITNLAISGSGVTAYSSGNVSITLENKYEKTFTLSSTDTEIELDYSNVENIVNMIVTADGAYTIEFSIGTGANVIVFTLSEDTPFMFPTTQTFIDTLDSIILHTASTADVTVSVRFFGEEVSS